MRPPPLDLAAIIKALTAVPPGRLAPVTVSAIGILFALGFIWTISIWAIQVQVIRLFH